jgi:hypothetical protein
MKFISKLKLKKIEGIAFTNNGSLPEIKSVFAFTLKIIGEKEKSGYPKIDNKKNNNNTCYAVFDNDKLIHESWIFKKKLLTAQLGFRLAQTVGDCYTIDSYKGKGIYTFVLKKILADHLQKQLIIYTDKSNEVSIKGILKAGFVKLYSFKIVRILGIKLFVRRYEN